MPNPTRRTRRGSGSGWWTGFAPGARPRNWPRTTSQPHPDVLRFTNCSRTAAVRLPSEHVSVGAGLTGRGDVLGLVLREDLLGARALRAVVGVHRDQEIPALDLGLVLLRLVLRDAEPDQCAGQSPGSRASRCSAERGHDGTRRDEGPDPRDRERPDAREQSQRAPDDATGRCAGGGPLRHLRSLLVREVARPLLVREQHRDVAIGESRSAQIGHDLVRLLLTLCDAQNCVSSHCGLLHWVVRLLRDFEVVLDLVRAGDLLCLRGDVLPLVLALHGSSQRHASIDGDDLHVVSRHGERLVGHHCLTDLLCERPIGFRLRLVTAGEGVTPITHVASAVVGRALAGLALGCGVSFSQRDHCRRAADRDSKQGHMKRLHRAAFRAAGWRLSTAFAISLPSSARRFSPSFSAALNISVSSSSTWCSMSSLNTVTFASKRSSSRSTSGSSARTSLTTWCSSYASGTISSVFFVSRSLTAG